MRSTNDRYVNNEIDDASQPTGTARGIFQFFEVHGGGIAMSGDGLELEGRNLVAAGNRIPFGQGGGVSSDDGPSIVVFQVIGRGGRDPSALRLLDSTVVANEATDGTGSGIYGNFDDDLVVHNGIVFGNTSSQGTQIAGFDDGGSKDIRFTDYCAEEAEQPERAAAAGEGNICEEPQLVDPANGDVHQKKDVSPTLDKGSDALVPSGLTGDWDRPADARIADAGSDGARVDMGADELVVPSATPPAQPVTPAAAQPQPQAQVLGTQKRSCRSRRAFRIRLRVPRGKQVRSATVRVNNRKVRVVRGKRLRAPVVLRGLPKGRFTVKITIVLANGRKVTGKRVYHTCRPALPGDGPPPV